MRLYACIERIIRFEYIHIFHICNQEYFKKFSINNFPIKLKCHILRPTSIYVPNYNLTNSTKRQEIWSTLKFRRLHDNLNTNPGFDSNKSKSKWLPQKLQDWRLRFFFYKRYIYLVKCNNSVHVSKYYLHEQQWQHHHYGPQNYNMSGIE